MVQFTLTKDQNVHRPSLYRTDPQKGDITHKHIA